MTSFRSQTQKWSRRRVGALRSLAVERLAWPLVFRPTCHVYVCGVNQMVHFPASSRGCMPACRAEPSRAGTSVRKERNLSTHIYNCSALGLTRVKITAR